MAGRPEAPSTAAATASPSSTPTENSSGAQASDQSHSSSSSSSNITADNVKFASSKDDSTTPATSSKRRSLSSVLGCPSSTSTASPNDSDAYGLSGILRVVRLSNTPSSLLSLGTDLTTLGLNLNAPDTLYASFFSPNLEQQPPKEDVEFYLPPCCYMNPPNLKMTHLQKFTAETLFYMFYTIVGDILQGYAAAELFNRGWVYHKEFQKWFTTAAAQRATGANDIREPAPSENTWIYFEPSLWMKRFYTGDLDATKFLKSESLRDLLDETLQRSQASAAAATQSVDQSSLAALQLQQQMRQQQQQASPLGAVGLGQSGLGQSGLGQASTTPGLLSQQVTAAFQAQQQHHHGLGGLGSASGLGSVSGLGAPPGILGGSGGQSLGNQTTSHLGGGMGGLQGTVGRASNGGMTSSNPVSMASLQSAIEALLARGLQQQPQQ